MTATLLNDHAIEQLLSAPTASVVATAARLQGDCVVLGVGGKMGTSLALMLRRALDQAGRRELKVIGVSRFSRAEARRELEENNVRTHACDLAEPEQVGALPEAAHVFYLSGQKFGTDGNPEATWIQNAVVPALVARRYPRAAWIVFSTGCVYPFMPTGGPGATEAEPLAFNGEYAASCIARERVFTHFSKARGTRVLLFRLNYATELRYGVLVDIAMKVLAREPVDLSTGWVNCIWQGDACAQAIRCLELVAAPARALNITGSEKLSVREIAGAFGRRFGVAPIFTGTEAPTAWLSDAGAAWRLFGPPVVPVSAMLDLVASHLQAGGGLLGKPTHFETRSGKF
jgi:nucleoside-diphosphate-sugar epimerase